MRNLLALPLVAAVACAGGTFKDQARAAMPTSDTVSMGSPNSSAAETAKRIAHRSVMRSSYWWPAGISA